MKVSRYFIDRFSDVRASAKTGISRVAVPIAALTLLAGGAIGYVITAQPAGAVTVFAGTMSTQGGSENPGTLTSASASDCGTLWAGYNWTIPGGPTGGSDVVDLTSLTWSFPYTCTGSGAGTFVLTAPPPGPIDATGTGHYPTANAGDESSNESWEAVPITLTNGCTSGTPVFTENNGTFTAPFTATTDDTINYQSHASYCVAGFTVPSGSNPNQNPPNCAAGSWGPTDHVTPTPVASTTTDTTATLTGSAVLGAGGTITDEAVVTGSLGDNPNVASPDSISPVPTGSVAFFECGPSAAPSTCPATGTPYSTGTLTGSGTNTATASSDPPFTPSGGPGYYCFSAVYTPTGGTFAGSSDNTSGDPVAAECVLIQAAPSLTSQASPTAGVVGTALTNVGDSATLHNPSADPTGDIAFALFSDVGCMTAVSGVSGSGAITTTAGVSTASFSVATWTPPAVGTYYWKVSYAGDANNAAASICGGTGEEITVTAAATGNNSGGSTPLTPLTPAAAPATPVAGATLVTTGEPWAGSKGIELAVMLLGLGLLTAGLLRRRILRRGAEAGTD